MVIADLNTKKSIFLLNLRYSEGVYIIMPPKPQTDSKLLRQVQRLKAAQAAQEANELDRLVRAYATINNAAAVKAEALANKIALQFSETGKYPTRSQIMRLSQYRDLMNTIDTELTKYEAFMRVEMSLQSRLAITEGERDARTIGRIAAQEAGANAAFRAINPAVIEQLVGFLDPGGPLYNRLGMLSSWTSEQVSNKILEGVGLGLNPKTTARALTKTITDGITDTLGMGLTDSMRMMRTVQLYSYREANRASYLANSDIVRGWVWFAELDGDTCASCWAMHGTEHTLDETLDDHHNGRCAMVPMVIGASNPVTEMGTDAFDKLSEQEQKDILGPSKWDAWSEGKFTLSDIPTQTENDVYGLMRTERSLKDLIGGGE